MSARPVSAGAEWVSYVAFAPSHRLRRVRDALLPTLHRLARARGVRFNFNTYADTMGGDAGDQPHLSLRMSRRDKVIEAELQRLKAQRLITSWRRQPYTEEPWVRLAYELGTRLYLQSEAFLDTHGARLQPDDRFWLLVHHGLHDNIACGTQRAEIAFWKDMIPGLNRLLLPLRSLQHAALKPRDMGDAETYFAEVLEDTAEALRSKPEPKAPKKPKVKVTS